MVSEIVGNYITKRYNRWLDYSMYHCKVACIPNEAVDVLNEVLCDLLQKNSCFLERLLLSKKDGCTELDFFLLRMIKLNVYSITSPYQNRYRSLPSDTNIDYASLDIEDVVEANSDNDEWLINRFRQVREVFEHLDLSPIAKKVFEFRFFQDENFSDWIGPESPKQLYKIYKRVLKIIREKITGESIF